VHDGDIAARAAYREPDNLFHAALPDERKDLVQAR
jgi:hypothetical protein